MEEVIEVEEQELAPYEFDAEQANSDFAELICSLENYHSLFYQLGVLGQPIWTEEVDTAAVAFNHMSNSVLFMWNPKFWDSLNKYQRQFIACHEAMHVFMSHGKRMKEMKQPQIANIAADVVVNEMLIEKFGFNPVLLGNLSDQLVWFDKYFEEPEVERGRSFEYYYDRLIEQVKDAIREGKIKPMNGNNGNGAGITIYPDEEFKDLFGDSIDDHENLEDIDSDTEKQISNKIGDKVQDEDKEHFRELTDSDIQNAPKGKPKGSKGESEGKGGQGENKSNRDGDGGGTGGLEAGTLAGNMCRTVPKKPTKYNTKWSDIIKNWKLRHEKPEEYEESWAWPNRRTSFIKTGLNLPSQRDSRQGKQKKVTVWFFMDTSGSCVHMADEFFRCAETFPQDVFDLTCFCFDTKVYEINLKDRKLYGFGGTRFDIIETKIQALVKSENKKYPDVVFVFTDGYGNNVHPEKPERWYWFLDGGYSTKECIPKTSIVYNLKDFAN